MVPPREADPGTGDPVPAPGCRAPGLGSKLPAATAGGLTFDPETYEEQLRRKCERVSASFGPLLGGAQKPLAVFPSPRRHFRMRQNFSIDLCPNAGKPVYVWGGPYVPMDTFPAASETICNMMPLLMARLRADAILADNLSAVHFLSTLSGELVISLFYNRVLHKDWASRAAAARGELGDEATLSIMGHSKGLVETVGRDYVMEVLQLSDGRQLRYRQMVGSFSNPNAYINQDCLGWLCETMQRLEAGYGVCNSGDLLELYCGNGNHTCALAAHFRKVLAVELSRTLCDAAAFNLAANGVSNAKIVASDSAKFCFRVLRAQAWRDPDTQAEYHFRVVLVDPPRQGLDATTLKLVKRYDAIVYISCGAEALKDNLQELTKTHTVVHAAFFDHFAYTPHLETALCLVRHGLPDKAPAFTAGQSEEVA